MRALFAIAIVSLAASGCTPFIPVKDDFGTSALIQARDVPPEFAEFNAYDPSVNPLLANQLCATSYQPLQDRSVGASPGRLVASLGRCQTHVPLLGP
jgi:hypothetical protein